MITESFEDFNKFSIHDFSRDYKTVLNKYSTDLEKEDIQLDLNMTPGVVAISMIEIPKNLSKRGLGSLIMNNIIQVADKNKIILTLKPAGGARISKDKLIKWYKSLGFVENKGSTSIDNDDILLYYRMPL